MSEQNKEERPIRDLPADTDVKGGGGADNLPLAEILAAGKKEPAANTPLPTSGKDPLPKTH